MAFTFFFRDQHVLELVVEHLIPSLAGRSRPRIWDAGCAMGQEPYTLAIMLAEKMSYFGFNNLRIDASDRDNKDQFGRILRAAVYPWEEVARMPEGVIEKYFEPNGEPDCYRAVERIRDRIAYQQHDLLSLKEIGHGYTLVLCKNVLLHFEPEEAAPLFDRLAPDGQVFRKVEGGGCGC